MKTMSFALFYSLLNPQPLQQYLGQIRLSINTVEWIDLEINVPWDFPGGAVVKNPPANAGDTGLISGPGRSHMPWSS